MTRHKLSLLLAGLAGLASVLWIYAGRDAAGAPEDSMRRASSAAADAENTDRPRLETVARDASLAVHESACASVIAGGEAGMIYRYSLDTPRASQQLVLELTSREADASARIDTWHVSLEAEDQPTLEDDLVRHCDARGEPDFWGPLGVPGITEISEPTWRWPARLRAGQSFEGDVTTRIGDDSGTSHRTHRVVGREPVSVPAGDFDCWRVEVLEQLAGEEDAPGTLWIADGVGLVRSRREYLPGEEEIVELVSVEQAS